jgi:DNA polymerase
MANSNLLYTEQRIQNCQRCTLHKKRTQIVFGSGNPSADLMFVGEAPGQNEDLQGLPFVGQSGDILDRSMKNVGLIRADSYITNVVKCRPPHNRDPRPDEIDACAKFLAAQIFAIKPRVLVALGSFAGNFLAGELDQMIPVHLLREDPGITFNLKNKYTCPVVATYHPAFVGRCSRQGDTAPLYQFQADLQKAAAFLHTD